MYSVETGEPLALLPDGVIQGMRVGGTYGLAVKYLARKNASSLGLLGSGWQARFQIASASLVRKLSLVKVYSPNREHRNKFASDIVSELDINIRAVDSAEEAASGVDILVAATNAKASIVPASFVETGMHVAALQSELSEEALQKAAVLAIHSSKRYLIYRGGSGRGQYGELTPHRASAFEQEKLPLLEDIIAGKVPGRTRDDQVTVFHSGAGMGLQFAAVGAKVYALARECGLGHEIPTEWFTQTLHT